MATKKAEQSKSTSLVKWDDELKALAQKTAIKEQVSDGFRSISFRGGQMSIGDDVVKGNELECVVIASVHANLYYDSDYNPSKVVVPICYAFGDPDADDPTEGMAPHENCSEPQSEQCQGCPMNEFGSADRGRGKACKNVRRMAVIDTDSLKSADDLAKAEPYQMQIPVTSVKRWAKYANTIAKDMERPPFAVVTKVKISPDPHSQYRVDFEFERLIEFDGELFEAMKKKVKAAETVLTRPFPTQDEIDKMHDAPKSTKAPGNGVKASVKASVKDATKAASGRAKKF